MLDHDTFMLSVQKIDKYSQYYDIIPGKTVPEYRCILLFFHRRDIYRSLTQATIIHVYVFRWGGDKSYLHKLKIINFSQCFWIHEINIILLFWF